MRTKEQIKDDIDKVNKDYEEECSIVSRCDDFDKEVFVLYGMYVEIEDDGNGVDGDTALEELEVERDDLLAKLEEELALSTKSSGISITI